VLSITQLWLMNPLRCRESVLFIGTQFSNLYNAVEVTKLRANR